LLDSFSSAPGSDSEAEMIVSDISSLRKYEVGRPSPDSRGLWIFSELSGSSPSLFQLFFPPESFFLVRDRPSLRCFLESSFLYLRVKLHLVEEPRSGRRNSVEASGRR